MNLVQTQKYSISIIGPLILEIKLCFSKCLNSPRGVALSEIEFEAHNVLKSKKLKKLKRRKVCHSAHLVLLTFYNSGIAVGIIVDLKILENIT